MGILQMLGTGAGLSMDAFAVSICRGLGMKKINHSRAVIIALFFGGFQALMPAVGWFLGSRVLHLIKPFDHWIAFGLLAVIGGKMIFDTLKKGDAEEAYDDEKFSYGNLFLMAVATSIDALAVGLTLGVLGSGIGIAALVIGCTTFAFSLAGVYIGFFVGGKFRDAATLVGGIVLMLIGLQILLQHFGVIG